MMSPFQPFEMERMMSKHEQEVRYNLSESGVHPVTLRELLAFDPAGVEGLLDTELNYPHVNGIPELRENIARLYRGAEPDNILVTVGGIEANYLAIRTLLSPGDEIAIMSPNYMQIWGVAKNHGLAIRTFGLSEADGWALDASALDEAVTPQTRLIAVCNPNNPTGHVLSSSEMERVVAAADRVGAWILADEVYCGAERVTERETPSFYGRYPKVIAVGSMSKAYGLPGLRLGWVAAPAETVEDIWARLEYLTLSATMLANKLAALALAPDVRPQLLARTRRLIRQGYPILETWIEQHGDAFALTPPDAAAIAFLRYRFDVGSTLLVERLRREKSVLVVPGDHFGMDHFLRISFGLPEPYLLEALERVRQLLATLRQVHVV
ncbi:MAG: aminotransferase class I/II-fold pyridoxal phosphate-dependent enzyme [Trueperaceae bacterium]|nr:MAG: aminotransferase class I/II-fold pyridoxal phosphate-dependent enzyme [Trueperaceae bacterium]